MRLLDAVRYVPPEARRETVVERLRSLATEVRRGKGFRRVPRWVWVPSVAVMALAIVIAGLAVGLPASTIAKRADELDRAHHYNLGGILRNLACARGDGEACRLLGTMYLVGPKLGVAKDKSRAAELFSKACDAGNAYGCENLGNMYDHGNGVEQSPTRAATLYSREAALYLKACDEAAKLH